MACLPDDNHVQVSVIVTTKNSARTLEACLSSVRSQSHPGIELILVDNHSTDETIDIAGRYCDIVVSKGPERSAQRNYGAELSSGDYLLFIDSDMVLDAQVVSDGVRAFTDPAVRGVVVPEISFGEGFWTRCRILERQCYTGDDDVEAVRLYRRSDFFEAGGFDLELNGPEDWDLSRRVSQGTKVPRTSSWIHHDEGRITLLGSFVKRRYYAPGYLRYLRKHRSGALRQANPVLRTAYLRQWRRLAAQPVVATGMFVIKVVETLAVLEVAAEQSLLRRRQPAGYRDVYSDPKADRARTRGELASVRPLVVTFGSVQDAHGGVQTRARVTAETFAELGLETAVVSTREPVLPTTPPWASSLTAPARRPVKGFSLAFVRLIRAQAASSSVLVITNAMFMPAITAARVRLPIIWDTNECQTLHYQRLPRTVANRFKYLTWFVLERWAARRCWMAIAIGEEEAKTWRSGHERLAGKLEVVDHATLAAPRQADEAREALQRRLGTELHGPVLLFLGTLRAKHNMAAARWILDVLVPTLGREDTVVLCGPGSDQLVSGPSPADGPTVVGLGAVEDVDSVVAAADLCLAPQAAGAGVKTKVLHYLAHGKRVAGTDTAFEGLAGAPGLYAATLDDLPGLVQRLRSELEPTDAKIERIDDEKAWMSEHHGRARVAAQWKKVLVCLPSS